MLLLKNYALGIAILTSFEFSIAADLNPEEGLKKLDQNIEISSKNKEGYIKAIEQASQNINTLNTANNELLNQKKKIIVQQTENKNTIALHAKKLIELDKAKKEEEKRKADELIKINQYEKLLSQLKDLQKNRDERIQKLTQDRVLIETSKKEGEALQVTLANESKEVDQRSNTLKKETEPWISKKKNFEKEASRWTKETDRHEKMKSEIKLLMDSTT